MTEMIRRTVLLLSVAFFCAAPQATAAEQGLRDRVRALAEEFGFAVQGLELIPNEPAEAAGGDLRQRLKSLLYGYNYLVIDNDQGDIRRIIFLPRGEEGDLPAVAVSSIDPLESSGEHIVPTRRRGMHQAVEGVLAGPNLVPVSMTLIVDTGASTIVLPSSMIRPLGFQAELLDDVLAQTANGEVRAKSGMLNSVTVGGGAVENVAVIFIDDQRLNGNLLLGMSFLRHFRMTIDDDSNRIILTDD